METLVDPVVIGVILAPHGVRGTLRVKAPGSGAHLRSDVQPVVNGKRRRIVTSRVTSKGFLVDLEGIGDRNLAASLRGCEMLVDRQELDAPDEGDFYIGDLIGLAAYDEAGKLIGSIVDVLETPAHEVLLIGEDETAEQHYVPFTHEHVPLVDPEAGRIVVSPPQTASE